MSRASGVRKGASRAATADETPPGPAPWAARTLGSGPPPRAGCAGAVGGNGRCCGVDRVRVKDVHGLYDRTTGSAETYAVYR